MSNFRSLRFLIFAGVLAVVLPGAPSSVRADDSDQPQMFPNRMQVNPQGNQTPPVHAIAVPNQEGAPAPGGALSPYAGSQMGFGIQLPLGGSSAPLPAPSPELKPKPAPSQNE